MSKYRNALPQEATNRPFLHFVGIGTEFVFKHKLFKPGEAVFSVYSQAGVRELIVDYYSALISVAREHGSGVVLDVPTWDAHEARGWPLGVSRAELHDYNRNVVLDAVTARKDFGDLPTVIGAPIGPRGDAFEYDGAITEAEAEDYHSDQMEVLAATDVDCIDAFTLPDEVETVGMVRAAQSSGLPIVVSFTLGTDGHLPSGSSLERAIDFVDERTGGYARYFLVNCIHPIHFPQMLTDATAIGRLRGIVANASHADHADLNESNALDQGDPEDLGSRIKEIATRYSHFNVFGGCCGTDMSHMNEIARHL